MRKKLYYGDATTRLGRCECNPIDLTQFGKRKPIGIATDFGSLDADEVGLYDEDAVNALCQLGIARYRHQHGRPPVTAPANLLSVGEYAEQERHGMATDYNEQLDRLRELRLWHWRQALQCRNNAQTDRISDAPLPVYQELMDVHANRHIRFVQTLNDFFAMDDTAEADAAKAARDAKG